MASRGVNKVILVGTLGQDPEVRFSSNNQAMANISVATSETWNDKQTGEKREKTEWHRVVLFGKLAEIAGEYLKKGSQVYLEGQLQTRKWQDQNGQDRYSTEVVVNSIGGVMQMLGGRPSNQNGSSQEMYPNNAQQNPQWGNSPANQGRAANQFDQSPTSRSEPQAAPVTPRPVPPAAPTSIPQAEPNVLANNFEDDDIPF